MTKEITFIGDPASPDDRKSIVIDGVEFALGVSVQVTDGLADRLSNHSHFKVTHETGRSRAESAGENRSAGGGGDGDGGRPDQSQGKTVSRPRGRPRKRAGPVDPEQSSGNGD